MASYSASFAVDFMGLLQESASEGLLERSWSLRSNFSDQNQANNFEMFGHKEHSPHKPSKSSESHTMSEMLFFGSDFKNGSKLNI
jgi:hypothetical protein